MAKFITTKYGTKIDVSDLTPEQIKRVRSIAEDSGSYGKKGAALADMMRKRNAKKEGPADSSTPTEEANPLDTRESSQGGEDVGTTGLGDTAVTIDNYIEQLFKDMKPLDLSGAPKILTDNDLQATRQQAYQGIYDNETKNLERRKALELEQQKQELANRGIPYNPNNEESLYGRTIAGIQDRYDKLYQDASVSANAAADERLKTLSNVNTQAYSAFLEGATADFKSRLDAASTSGSVLKDLMNKYGISEEAAQRALDRKMQEKVARINASRSTGSGAAAEEDSGPIFGGDAP